RGARFRRLTGRMKRIAEADERAHAELVRDHARDAAAERLSADGDPRTAAEFRDDVAPRVEQYRLSIGRAALLPFTTRGHVRELESDDANPALRETARDVRHERRVHRAARAVRENERRFGVVGTIGEKRAHE